MKNVRIVLSLFALIAAVAGSFAARADKSATVFYGHPTSGTISCTTGTLQDSNACTGTGAQCTVKINVPGGTQIVSAWLTNNPGTSCSSAAQLVP